MNPLKESNSIQPTKGIRLSKYLAEQGICSRREADEFIQRGFVFVNNRVAEIGCLVTGAEEIRLSPKALVSIEAQVTILLNKPIGYVSNLPEGDKIPAKILITPQNQRKSPGPQEQITRQHLKNLAVAGRLDWDSHGLLVFTQSGTLARRLIGENSTVDKEYEVSVSGAITEDKLAKLRFGLVLDGRPLKSAKVTRLGPNRLGFVLIEGRKRQIRRMCHLVGLQVTDLLRTRIGKIRLADLANGQWRFLSPDENF